jgi:hypothetical protein
MISRQAGRQGQTHGGLSRPPPPQGGANTADRGIRGAAAPEKMRIGKRRSWLDRGLIRPAVGVIRFFQAFAVFVAAVVVLFFSDSSPSAPPL